MMKEEKLPNTHRGFTAGRFFGLAGEVGMMQTVEENVQDLVMCLECTGYSHVYRMYRIYSCV